MKIPENLNTLKVEEPEPHLWVVRFNRPEVLNALGTKTSQDMRTVFGPLGFTPGDLRCIILTGTGDRAFSAGGDLKERHGMTDDAWRLQHAIIEEGAYALLNCAVPVIAAVNGIAMGGGLELALCCDFIYAASTARFALPEVTRGIIPGAGGTQNLPRAVGERRAKEIILTGRPFTAVEAFQWGMVNRLCAPGRVVDEALETGRGIADNAPISVRQAKQAIHFGMQMDLASGMVLEIEAYNRMVPTEDRREGVAAFNEKRKPRFKGQ